MPLLIDTDSRTALLVRAVNDVLIDHGPAGLTLRRIARVSGVSTSSILHHLGSREHLLRVAGARTGAARIAALKAESATDGILAFLPRTDDEVLELETGLALIDGLRTAVCAPRRPLRRDEARVILATWAGAV